jgi:hypothetical protein
MRSIGFIGAGNMGFALAKAAAVRFPGLEIQVVDPKAERVELFRRELANVRSGGSSAQLAAEAQLTVLAVKPQDFPAVLGELGDCRGLLVSIAAGVTLARMERALPRARLVRVIPNTPCLVGEMAAGYAFGSRVIPADKELVRGFLAAAGRAVEVEERLLDAVTGLSGSGPAFVGPEGRDGPGAGSADLPRHGRPAAADRHGHPGAGGHGELAQGHHPGGARRAGGFRPGRGDPRHRGGRRPPRRRAGEGLRGP